jgi:exopolysaccharide production protein ExoZ
MPPQMIAGLQTLRAIAAIAVVVFHATWRAGSGWALGQAGVDVFFVISGFIMWVLSERGPSPASFALDRVLRITPLYWLATAGMLVGGLIHVFPTLILDASHVAASFLFVPYPSPNDGQPWPLLVQGWTLNYEMFFYALFAVVLCLPRVSQLAVLCAVLLMLAGAGGVLHPQDVAGRFYTQSIMLEFSAGACIGAAWTSNRMPGAIGFGWLLLAAGCGLFALASFTPEPVDRLLFWGGPSILLVAGVVALERNGVTLTTPALMFLGNASYSIYLFHTFAISIVARLLGDRLGFWPETAVSTIAGVAAGAIVYLVVEKPLIAFIKDIRRRRRAASALTPA